MSAESSNERSPAIVDESECLPRPVEIDLEKKADELGIKTFIVSVSSLALDQRILFVPKSAIRRAQENGVNFHGYFDFFTGGSEPECYFVPEPASMIQLPWKPEMAWVPSFAYIGGKPLPQCPRRCLVRQIERARELGYVLKTGIEPEFTLLKRGTSQCFDEMDQTVFTSLATMKASPFLVRLADCLDKLGWGPYKIEHEASMGQFEVAFNYADALTTADRWTFIKFMIQNLAEEEGMRATFMPLLNEEEKIGNSMHIHHSLWSVSEDKELLPKEDGKMGLSEIGLQFLAGQLKHLRGNAALFLSTVNSYKRFRMPNFLNVIAYAVDSRWPCIRIVTDKGKTNRFELRLGDAASNPFLAHAALLAAGLDGIVNKLELDEKQRVEGELIFEPPLEEKGYAAAPKSLAEGLQLLEKNTFASETFGKVIMDKYLMIKKEQWKEYHSTVSEWEKRFIDSY